MKYRLRKVISGGQTGADQAGIYIAKEYGFETGGLMPKQFKTEYGNRPDLGFEYNMKEHSSFNYSERTEINVRDSDATIIFMYRRSRGSALTRDIAFRLGKPYLVIQDTNKYDENAKKILNFLREYNPVVLNIAGNRGSTFDDENVNSKLGGITVEGETSAILSKVFLEVSTSFDDSLERKM